MGTIRCHGHWPEERQKALREQPRLRDASLALQIRKRRRAGIDAAHTKGDVRLQRGGEVGRPLEPDRPGAVVAHARHQLVRDPPIQIGRAQAERVIPEKMLRRHRHVRLELADPDAVRPLQLEQPLRAALDRGVQFGQCNGDGHLRP